MIHIRSQVKTRQGQSYKFLKLSKIQILQSTLHATHLLKLLDQVHKYEMDPTITVGATEHTQDVGWTSSVLRCLFSPNLVILTWTTDELWCRQAQNEVKFDFQVKFDLEGQGRSSQKTIGNLTVQTSLWLMYTPTHRSTDAGGDNTRRPKLASGKNAFENVWKMAQPQCLIQLDTGNLCNILYDTLQKQCYSADSRFAPSQWKRSLRSNAVSHWLGRKPRISPDVIILYLSFC